MCVKECGLGNFIWWAILSVTRSFFSRLNPSRQKTDIVRAKNAKNCASYVHCLQVAITTPKGGSWGYLYKRCLQITHLALERLATPPGSTSPAFFELWGGFFYVPQEPDKWKCCETGPTVFRPYPRRLESLTVCRCYYKGSPFFSKTVNWSLR